MRINRRLLVGCTALGVVAAVAGPAAAGHGGGNGGGGGPGSQPYIQFKSGGYSVPEGTTNAIVTLQRVPKGSDQVYFSTNGSPNGAVGGADCSDPATDYVTQTNRLVGIGSNGIGTALVPICNNSIYEPTETVFLALSAAGTTPVGGKITAGLTINDNDPAPVVSINPATSGAEGTDLHFTITLTGAHQNAASVNYSSADGTAVAPDDYGAVSSGVSWASGQTGPRDVVVSAVDDGVAEPDETFTVNLSAPSGASLASGASQSTGTITDNDSGFENGLGDWTPSSTGDAPAGAVSTDQAHSGTHSALLGGTAGCACSEPNGTSRISLDVAVPATGTTTLSFWVFEQGDGNNGFGGTDDLRAEVHDNADAFLATIFDDHDATSGWIQKTFDLTTWAGSTVKLVWIVDQDGLGAPSAMYLDDVVISTV